MRKRAKAEKKRLKESAVKSAPKRKKHPTYVGCLFCFLSAELRSARALTAAVGILGERGRRVGKCLFLA